jgi:hypothetical protein
MKKNFLYSALLGLVSIYATCHKSFDCHDAIYSFEANYSIHPDVDSVRIGDTVWLELKASTKLNNLYTNQIVDYSGAVNFGTAIGYLKLVGGDLLNPGSVAAADSFENILIKGKSEQSLNPAQVRNFLFTEENGMYVFKLGMVSKAKGLFAIGPGNAVNVYTNTNKCNKANFTLTFKNTDQHLYLYEQSRPGYTPSEYEKTHMYCLKVY